MCDTPYCMTVGQLKRKLAPFSDDVQVLITSGDGIFTVVNVKFQPEGSINNPEVVIVAGQEVVY